MCMCVFMCDFVNMCVCVRVRVCVCVCVCVLFIMVLLYSVNTVVIEIKYI